MKTEPHEMQVESDWSDNSLYLNCETCGEFVRLTQPEVTSFIDADFVVELVFLHRWEVARGKSFASCTQVGSDSGLP